MTLIICTSTHFVNLHREYLVALLQNCIPVISNTDFSTNVQLDTDACRTLSGLANKYWCYLDLLSNHNCVMWYTKLFPIDSVIYSAHHSLWHHLVVVLSLFDHYLSFLTCVTIAITTNLVSINVTIMTMTATDNDGKKVKRVWAFDFLKYHPVQELVL